MKKIFLLSVFAVTFSYSQVTDENGSSSVDASNSFLTGNIGIGVTPSSSSTNKLEVNGAIQATKMGLTHNLTDGMTFVDYADRRKQTLVFSAGSLVEASSGVRTFNYYEQPVSNYNTYPTHYLAIEDKNFNSRLRFKAATNGPTDFVLFDKNQGQFFAMNDDGDSNVWLHMPKANSRFVIGSHGLYLPEHKFVIKNGSAMIEGNVLTNANIGIGTSSFVDGVDTYRLSVDGKVRAHEIKVYTTWADFVFEADYKLPTLSEVENYINENGHLMNIPSAEEVEDNGVELGELNKLLLQKIEELTLYVIDLKKEVEILKIKE